MERKDEFMTIIEIAKIAEANGLMALDRFTLVMDLEVAHKECNLRLDELLNADELNFAHDVVGIQNNLNRQTMKMENLFLPRYATQ